VVRDQNPDDTNTFVVMQEMDQSLNQEINSGLNKDISGLS
jgi:hypothetical protein